MTLLSQASSSSPAQEAGSPVVLIVEDNLEDNAQVRDLLQSTLAQEHYTLLTARNGEEALAVAAVCPVPVSVLVTDVLLLPPIDGFELAEHLRCRQPQLKTIFVSGHGHHDDVARYCAIREEAFHLPKPFAMDDLLEALRSLTRVLVSA